MSGPDLPARVLSADETWSGETALDRDVLVPRGVTLTLAPGCVVRSPHGAPYLIKVAGRLIAEGAPEAPISLGGPADWGGLLFIEEGTGRLSEAVVRRASYHALGGAHEARVRARRVRLEDCGAGAAAVGASALELEDCEIVGSRVMAARLGGSGKLLLRRCRVVGTPNGLVADGGSIEAEDCSFSGLGDYALLFSEGARARLKRCRFEGGRRGAWLFEGRLEMSDCELSEQDEAGLTVMTESSASLSGCRLSGAKYGAVAEGALELSDCRFSGQTQTGLHVSRGGSARLTRCRFAVAPCGIVAEGPVELSDCGLEGHADAALALSGAGHRLAAVSISKSGRGLLLPPGASEPEQARLLAGAAFSDCRENVLPEPGAPPRPSEDAEEALPAGRRALLRWVLATKGFPPLRAVYLAVYALAVGVVSRWARSRPEVVSAWVHRGWASGNWEPGISDLDLVVLAGGLEGAPGAAWLSALARRHASWKRWFPFLGETLVAEPADWDAFRRWGGGRAQRHRKLLAGTLPTGGAPAAGDPDPLECAHAYTRLMKVLFEPRAEPWARTRALAFKAALDLLRHARPGLDPAASRRQAWEELPRAGLGAWKERLRPLLEGRAPSPATRERLLAETGAEALRFLDAEARPASGPLVACRTAAVALSAGESSARARRLESVELLRRATSGALTGAVLDDLYRTYALFDEAPGVEPWLGLARLRPRGCLPVPLTRRLWAWWRRLPYLEDPANAMDDSPDLLSAGRLFPDACRLRWGATAESLEEGVRAEAALAAWANLRFTWRLHAFPEARVAPEQTAHYLLTRTLGLRLLLERRVVVPFFDADAVLTAYREEFGAAPATTLEFDRLYPFADAQLRATRPDAAFRLDGAAAAGYSR